MKILHYTLGFSPERSGGLVNYATDLIHEEIAQGHQVSALYPGGINFLKKTTYIKKDKHNSIMSYQIINGLPLPLFGGIKSPEDFMKSISISLYIEFLKDICPEVIHVHSLMGIHKEFFEAADKLSIPIVFTSHDYFGLSPEPNFFLNGNSYDDSNSIENWIKVSQDAMNTLKLRVFQLKIYPYLRMIMNKKQINKPKKEKEKVEISDIKYKKYKKLKKYYEQIFNSITLFHFNSKLSQEIYMKNLKYKINGRVVTITNGKIKNKKLKKRNSKKINIAYIGPNKTYKGFDEFIKLSNLLKNETNLEFHTYGYDVEKSIPNLFQHGKYKYSDLEKIYSNIDILIVPSRWKETFGLIVLEGISFGVPVIASKNVGASELLDRQNIFSDINEAKKIIINKKYKTIKKIKDIHLHTEEVIYLYKSINNE